jgi:hypothetical protein
MFEQLTLSYFLIGCLLYMVAFFNLSDSNKKLYLLIAWLFVWPLAIILTLVSKDKASKENSKV